MEGGLPVAPRSRLFDRKALARVKSLSGCEAGPMGGVDDGGDGVCSRPTLVLGQGIMLFTRACLRATGQHRRVL